MKRSLKNLIKVVSIIVLFTGSSIALSTAGVKTVSEANAAVSSQAVYNYLVSRGYTVITLNPASEGGAKTENWIAHTVLNNINYSTTVYVSGTQIIGNTDVPM